MLCYYRYACVNLSCFFLTVLRSPGFRPQWKVSSSGIRGWNENKHVIADALIIWNHYPSFSSSIIRGLLHYWVWLCVWHLWSLYRGGEREQKSSSTHDAVAVVVVVAFSLLHALRTVHYFFQKFKFCFLAILNTLDGQLLLCFLLWLYWCTSNTKMLLSKCVCVSQKYYYTRSSLCCDTTT